MSKRRDIISIGKYHSGKLDELAAEDAGEGTNEHKRRIIARRAIDALYERIKK